jgi:hypothetical protein
MAIDLDAYFLRIGYFGERTPTLETLRAINRDFARWRRRGRIPGCLQRKDLNVSRLSPAPLAPWPQFW